MIFHGLRLFHKNQMGFTLTELMLAIAITGVITGGVTTTIFQVFNMNTRTSNHMTAVRQVQNAGYWVSHDALMAQRVVITGVSGFPLYLTWTDWESGDVHQVTYTLADNKLQRSYSVNGVPSGTTFVAEFTDQVSSKFRAGSAFNLPDVGDAFTITDPTGGDSGIITITAGSISVTPTGSATSTYDEVSGVWTWSTPGAGDTVVVAATGANTTGDWTSTTGTATAAITVDGDGDATLADGGALIFTVTATVQQQTETRIYEVMPRPGS